MSAMAAQPSESMPVGLRGEGGSETTEAGTDRQVAPLSEVKAQVLLKAGPRKCCESKPRKFMPKPIGPLTPRSEVGRSAVPPMSAGRDHSMSIPAVELAAQLSTTVPRAGAAARRHRIITRVAQPGARARGGHRRTLLCGDGRSIIRIPVHCTLHAAWQIE